MKHEETIKKMTLEEKASLLSGKNFWETMDYPEYSIPSMFLSDGPHGLRKQAASADQLGLNPSLPATCFPTASALANTWNPELTKEVGTALGKEATKLHVNMVLGPGVNIKRNPKCGRNFEYFSEDPYLAGKLASGLIQGIQSNGVSACIKHYCGNSQETRRINMDSIIDERALREIYTMAFEIAIKDAKPMALMSSYNMVNGEYTNENHYLETEVLRNEFQYKGLVVTDWGGENDRIKGLLEANELEMPGNNGDTDREIIKAVKDGRLDESVIDECCDRIIDLAIETSKHIDFSEAFSKTDSDGKKITGMNCFPELRDQHHLIAKKASDETMVLLKNEGNILPLKKDDVTCVIGDFANEARYQGAGSSKVNCTKLDKFVDLADKFKFNYLGYAQGFNRYGKKNRKLEEEALTLAKKADIILYFMGLDEVTESEGLDRKTINLPQNQIELLKKLKGLGKKVVVILSSGSVVDLSWDKDCDALLFGALSGQAGCNSIMEMLNGDVTPSGKLSETYPLAEKDVPNHDIFPSESINALYKESIYVGYRYFEKNDMPVKYPFGYGLSYTSFTYKNFSVDENGIKVTIANTGKFPGKEIVELYIGKKDSKIFRPAKELKGFRKTMLLQPGEEETIIIRFDEYTFRYFNVATKKFEIEDGEYEVYVGASSNDIKFTSTIKKEGTTKELPYNEADIPEYFSGKVNGVSDEEFAKLYGKEIPNGELNFVNKKKTRIALNENNLFADLKYARGWTGRLTYHVLHGLIKFGNKHNKNLANAIIMGPWSFPMRAISRMMNMPMTKAMGLMKMFDGHFFKGLHQFLHGSKGTPKYPKDSHYQKKTKA
jgi:beta-glucosidase